MKKPIVFLLIVAMLCPFSACEEPHTHSFSGEWSFDETYHWHKAVCSHADEIADKECHSFENGKCKTCDFEKPKPTYADSSVFSETTAPASEEDRERVASLMDALMDNGKFDGFRSGDLYYKEHTAEGTNALNREVTVDGFGGGLSVIDGIKVGKTESLPAYGGTQKRYFYADGTCAVEDLGREKNYYEARETVGFLVDDVFSEIKSQINYAHVLLNADADIGYRKSTFEIVKIEYSVGSNDRSMYVFAFYDGALAGLKVNRSYVTTVAVSKQIELLIGDYEVQKPDLSGFNMIDHKPKWAAGYPTEEIFGREYLLASDDQIKKVRELFKGAVSKLNLDHSLEILAEGDIRFLYESISAKNDITFDRDEIGMKVYEKSEGLLRSDKEGEITIEHYVDLGICYELLNGNTKAYLGDYSSNFYAMLPYTMMQLCEFMNQYLKSVNEGVPDAYEVYVCECEYDAVRLIVKDCAEISYIFDEDGKLLAAKIQINNSTAEIFTGKFNVTIPVFTGYDKAVGTPDIGYLGA